ncbi:MAG: hypothetical protein NWE93_08060 [Candidatus Bathyarchaeota archaeon]|nr:hypothetical protein [Candidatus Bathyarchaeota archaeon]
MAQTKPCSPTCYSFKCGKNAAFFRRDAVWCRDADEPCSVAKCTYAMCMKRRMLPGAICGETVKRKTVEKDLDEDFYQEDSSVKLKGKALRKYDEDLY